MLGNSSLSHPSFGSHSVFSGALHVTNQFSSPAFSTPTFAHLVASLLHKPFVVSPGYSPIPEKLVSKIKTGQFVDLADLLPENVKAQDSEPQTYLDGDLLMSTKKKVWEITDIITWQEAFTVYVWIFCCTHPSRWQDMTQYELLIWQTACQVSGKACFTMTQPFRKMQPHQVWPTGPVWTVICTTFILASHNNNSSSLPPLHPCLQEQLPLHLFSADPGIMAPVPGPMVNLGSITAVRSLKESILVSTAPFGPQRRMLSSHSPLPLHGANARGVETVTRMSTSSVNNVNSVLLCRSFSPSHSLFPVPVNVAVSSAHVLLARSRPQGLPAHNPLSSTCLVASTFQQDLVLLSRVTRTVAWTLFSPWSSQSGLCDYRSHEWFLAWFWPSVLSLQSSVHNMPSASLQPSVIDQCLLSELEKDHVAGPFLISPIPNLHISCFGVIPRSANMESGRLF